MNLIPRQKAHVYCPKDVFVVPPCKVEPMWKAMAFPFHLIGKRCKKCKELVGEHYLLTEDVKS